MKKILITGARGYIGSFLFNELQSHYKVIGTSLHEDLSKNIISLDIRNIDKVFKCLNHTKPDIIIHAGAVSNVRKCEENPTEAFQTNVKGTFNIIEGANRINAKIIFISSLASKASSNLYGKSKYDAENLIKNVNSGYEILQLSMTFGLSPNTTNDRPFNKIINTLKTGNPKIYDNYWKFQPTYTKHLLEILEQLLLQDKFLGRSIPITTKESCTMYQLASDLLPTTSNIKASNLYANRTEEKIIYDKSFKLNFPIFSYSTMIDNLKEELNLYLTNQEIEQ